MGNKFIKQLKTYEVVLSFKQTNDLKLCASFVSAILPLQI